MQNFVQNGNKGLLLLGIKNMSVDNKEKELKIWTKIINSFHFDKDSTLNLIYINHPMEDFIGVCIEVHDKALLDEKMKRYTEGLAYLLVYNFKDADIRLLSNLEHLILIDHLNYSERIPEILTKPTATYMNGPGDRMRILFSRIIDPAIIINKVIEFNGHPQMKLAGALDTRLGIRPMLDKKLFEVLDNAFLSYVFKYYVSEEHMRRENEQFGRCDLKRNFDFVREFTGQMGVPDKFVELVRTSKSSHELFSNPDIALEDASITAEFLLGYR